MLIQNIEKQGVTSYTNVLEPHLDNISSKFYTASDN